METSTFAELIAKRRDMEDMVRGAIRMRSRSYSPYSRFAVGAFIVVDNPGGWPGSARLWFAGCNTENKIYVVTHAEQSAIAQMIAKIGASPKPVITRVVMACATTHRAFPCGLCREWIAEFGTSKTEVFGVRLAEDGEEILGIDRATMSELLPHAFSL